ncbi:MAG: RDD family protein [Bdellovibrionaceae bacterium]|nr:RDD family protein [Pseudobdellovibrionaceae bacterium]NUM59658.1 RDD family protein [Pseudobdellovibrionaceae bacterium]
MVYFPSTWKRIIAKSIDESIILFFRAPVILVVVMNFIKMDEFRIHWAHLVYCFLVRLFYETLSLYFFSTTVGKNYMQLKVISRFGANLADKQRISFSQALLRSLSGMISFFFGVSFYMTLFLRHNRTHVADWLSDTQVVSLLPRDSNPKIRWILFFSFVVVFFHSKLQGTAQLARALQWKTPFIYLDSHEYKKMLNGVNFDFDFEEDDVDFEEED